MEPADLLRARQGIIRQGSAQASAFLYVVTGLVGIEPGRSLEQTFAFTPAGSDLTRYYGQAATVTTDEGRNFGVDILSWLTHDQPGELRSFWREPGTRANADPILLPDGTAEITLAIR